MIDTFDREGGNDRIRVFHIGRGFQDSHFTDRDVKTQRIQRVFPRPPYVIKLLRTGGCVLTALSADGAIQTSLKADMGGT